MTQHRMQEINGRNATMTIAALSIAVFVLGLGREAYVFQLGMETALKDLRHFDLDGEHSLPAWYSSILMLLAAALLALIGAGARNTGRRLVAYWYWLSIIFVGMAIDEAVSFHEAFIIPLREGLGLGGYFYHAWVLLGLIAVAVIGMVYLRFLAAIERRYALLFVLAGGLFVGGAVGMEMLGGPAAERYGLYDIRYVAYAMIEEGLEIAGLTLFVGALLHYVATRMVLPGVAISWPDQAPQKDAGAPRMKTVPGPAE